MTRHYKKKFFLEKADNLELCGFNVLQMQRLPSLPPFLSCLACTACWTEMHKIAICNPSCINLPSILQQRDPDLYQLQFRFLWKCDLDLWERQFRFSNLKFPISSDATLWITAGLSRLRVEYSGIFQLCISVFSTKCLCIFRGVSLCDLKLDGQRNLMLGHIYIKPISGWLKNSREERSQQDFGEFNERAFWARGELAMHW